jgi:putative membrane protein
VKFGVLAAAVIGFAVAAWLLIHTGVDQVFASIASVGWLGFFWLTIYLLPTVTILGAAWFVLAPKSAGATLTTFVIGRQMRDSSGDVLPFSQLGGIVIGARALTLRGVSPSLSFASAIADVTTELMAQIAFVVLGLGFCYLLLEGQTSSAPLLQALLAGALLLIPGIVVFVVLQRRGSNVASKLAERFLPAAVAHAAAFGEAINEIYARPKSLALSAALHLVAWIASAFWVWLGFHLMGAPVGFEGAIAIEALLCALRSVAVFVPASIGVQEAGYVALAPMFGAPAEAGLAVSLLKRARDILVGIPVLLIWQAVEGKRAFAKAEP